MKARLYIGLMSGTSMDAIDAVLVASDDAGFRVLHMHSEPYPAALKARLQRAIRNEGSPDEMGRLDRLIGEAFANCALALLSEAAIPASSVAAIGSHGQTLRHAPEGEDGFSLQVGDPNTIAERTGITTVADFRRRDVAAGGQGAPLAPAFHAWFFGSPKESRALLNLGGIANVTLIAPQTTSQSATPTPLAVTGFDTGPANTLLDNWCLHHRKLPFDADGRWARSGTLHQPLLNSFLADPYFQRRPPKSTGREYFNLAWLVPHLAKYPAVTAVDVQRTLLEFTAVSIADALQSASSAKLYVCGGGCRNPLLLERLCALMPERQVETTTQLGLAPEAVEGAAFAWLAQQTLAGLPGNIPASTGARGPRILGGIFPA
jgi:anhydro-N-acetylmuramic acid kinase